MSMRVVFVTDQLRSEGLPRSQDVLLELDGGVVCRATDEQVRGLFGRGVRPRLVYLTMSEYADHTNGLKRPELVDALRMRLQSDAMDMAQAFLQDGQETILRLLLETGILDSRVRTGTQLLARRKIEVLGLLLGSDRFNKPDAQVCVLLQKGDYELLAEIEDCLAMREMAADSALSDALRQVQSVLYELVHALDDMRRKANDSTVNGLPYRMPVERGYLVTPLDASLQAYFARSFIPFHTFENGAVAPLTTHDAQRLGDTQGTTVALVWPAAEQLKMAMETRTARQLDIEVQNRLPTDPKALPLQLAVSAYSHAVSRLAARKSAITALASENSKGLCDVLSKQIDRGLSVLTVLCGACIPPKKRERSQASSLADAALMENQCLRTAELWAALCDFEHQTENAGFARAVAHLLSVDILSYEALVGEHR